MKQYIGLNTELRKKATSNFEKDLYKLMNNSVFGKSIENLRKRVDLKLVRPWEEEKLRKLIASPSFNRANIFDDGLAAIHMHKSKLVLNRPIFDGMSVLDLSKTLMYDFYYNKLLKQYGKNVDLLYTDTDSLLLEISQIISFITQKIKKSLVKRKMNALDVLLLNMIKFTVQFETEGNGQNEIFSHMNTSEVKL